jgi:transcriptional regulator with XRE-family HTH domain
MMVEEYVNKIAQRIRNRRMELGLSIRETARLTDTSPSTIQKIESNEMVPSIAVLMKIARGLNQKVTSFFDDESESKQVVLIRHDDRKTTTIPASNLKVEDLGSSLADARMDTSILTIEKGGNSGKVPLIHEGEEIKFCMKGRIAYMINDEEYVLEAGDCIHFKSENPHYWKSKTSGITRVFSVVFNDPDSRPAWAKKMGSKKR